MSKSNNLLDPLDVNYKLEGIKGDYNIQPYLYTNYGFGLVKGINFEDDKLKYLFLTVNFTEPILVFDQKVNVLFNYRNKNMIMCTHNLKYPKKICKQDTNFFMKDCDRFYGDKTQASYDNGEILMKFINLDGLYRLVMIVFRINIEKTKIFAIEKVRKSFDSDKCVACLEKMSIIKIKPCNHICLCHECYYRLQKQKCPLCNGPIIQVE